MTAQSADSVSQNRTFCTRRTIHRRGGSQRTESAIWCANNFRLCRGRLAALGSDSAYDHEILHTYSLPGIIMRECHALISA